MLNRFMIPDAPERIMLRDMLIARSEREPSAPSHCVGGWRTADDLFTLDLVATEWLRNQIERQLLVTEIHAWGLVNKPGAYHRKHRHRDAFKWSGIYYVDPGGPGSGRTIFDVKPNTIIVEPKAGLLVVFESNVWHLVEPHRGLAPRVTIAFDAR